MTPMLPDDALDRRIRRFLDVRADELARQASPTTVVGEALVGRLERSSRRYGRRELVLVGLAVLLMVVAAIAVAGRARPAVPILGGFPIAAVWSPDGTSVAVVSYTRVDGVATDLVDVIATDGSGRQRLDTFPLGGLDPVLPPVLSWSPDGRYVVYLDASGASDDGFVVMPADGDHAGASRVDGWPIAWSPVEDRLLYQRSSGNGSDLHTYDPDGRLDAALTSGGRSGGGIWSPDGSRILYVDGVAGGTQQADSATWMMAADGAAKRRIGPCCDAGWAPDGTTVFTDDDGQRLSAHAADSSASPRPFVDIASVTGWLVAPDGRSVAVSTDAGIEIRTPGEPDRQLTTESRDRLEAWSPDGRFLAFVGSRPEGLGVYTVPAGGGKATLVAPSSSRLGDPWRPGSDGIDRLLVRVDGDIVSAAPDGSAPETLADAGPPDGSSPGDRIVIGPDGPDRTVYRMPGGGSRFSVTIENTTGDLWVVAFPAIDLFESGCLPATSAVMRLASYVEPASRATDGPASPPDACVMQPHQAIHVDRPMTDLDPGPTELRISRSEDGVLHPPVYVVVVDPVDPVSTASGS